MLKYRMVMVALALVVGAASVADAGIFFRRGGCPGGRCGVAMSAPAASTAQAEAPEVAETSPAQPEEKSETTANAGEAESTTTPSYPRRLARIRLFSRLFR